MDFDNIVVPDDISVQSNEERITIDPTARAINIPENYVIGVESDEKSDRMYFQCPKIVGDNVDLSKLKLYVNFENANKERDIYFIDDVTIEDENILFSWLFSRKVTKYKGDVKFIVCAKKSEDSLTLEWNTTVAKGLSLEGIEVEVSDEEKLIASDYLIQLEKELTTLNDKYLKNIRDEGTRQTNLVNTEGTRQVTNVTNKGSEQVQLVENAAKKALDSIPSAYTDLQKQVDTIETVTNASATGIVETTHTTNGYRYLGNSTEKPIKQIVIKGNSMQVKTTGKNLLNYKDITTEGKKAGITVDENDYLYSTELIDRRTFTYSQCSHRFSLNSGTYTIKVYFATKTSNANAVISILKSDDTALANSTLTNVSEITKTFTLTSKTDIGIIFKIYEGKCQIMLNEGSTTLPFEKYTGGQPSPSPEYPQEVTSVDKILATFKGNKSTLTKSLNHTLLKPLYRLSQNVYDYIDFNKGKLVRMVGIDTLDGVTRKFSGVFGEVTNGYAVHDSGVAYSSFAPMLSNKFRYTTKGDKTKMELYEFGYGGGGNTTKTYILPSTITSLTEANTWLQSNPITIYYQLPTPTEEDIPSALLTQLQALQTYYPETFINFTSTVKPFVDLEYIADTKHSINSVYNTINRSLGINSIDNDVAGVQISYSTKTNTRLAGAIGLTSGESFNKFNMFGGRKRCNVADDGTILAYYGDSNYKEDGSNGQVMVYQPKVYYLVLPLIYDKIDNIVGGYHLRKANYYVSLVERPGFKLHPAFINENGDEVDYILKSAFEGSIYDVSAGKYLTDDEQIMDATVDKLCSIAGVRPCSGTTQSLTRDKAEQMARNRGDGWHCSDIRDMSLEQLLMMIELGSMNVQSAIGQGVVSIPWTTGSDTTSSYAAVTGSTSSLGNSTGQAPKTTTYEGGVATEYTTNGKTSITYRGVENFWGNIWKFAEGVNFYGDGHQRGGQPYICKDFNYKEGVSSDNYEPVGFTLTNDSGYVSAIGYNPNFDWLFFASESKGDSNGPVGDNAWVNSNLNRYRVALLGADWSNRVNAGAFDWSANGGVGYCSRNIGARLVYVPTK